MTQRAVAGVDTHVVKRRTRKFGGGMAVGAILRIGIGRHVINQLTNRDHIIVAGVAAVHDTGMIEGATGKGARCMAHGAILIGGGGRHVVERFTTCCHAVAVGAVVDDAGVIGKRAEERIGIVAIPAIGVCYRVGGYCRAFSGRTDTVVIVMAGRARLRYRVDDGVVKHPAKAEGGDAVAGGTVDGGVGVADGLTRHLADAVAGVAPLTDNIRAGMVRVGG